jgi:hypothetical protein
VHRIVVTQVVIDCVREDRAEQADGPRCHATAALDALPRGLAGSHGVHEVVDVLLGYGSNCKLAEQRNDMPLDPAAIGSQCERLSGCPPHTRSRPLSASVQ